MASVSSANRTNLPVPGQGSAAQPGGSMGDVPRDPTPGVPERLVQATIGLSAKQGPSAIKARTVASASGLSTIAVYHYFGGIAELMRAVVDHGFIELDRAFAQVPETEDPLADLFARALMCRRFARDNPHLYDLMFGLSRAHEPCARFGEVTGSGSEGRGTRTAAQGCILQRSVGRAPGGQVEHEVGCEGGGARGYV